ncbi:protein SHQ1 homolog isoform 1-T3 [Aulostomus maculatus]
MITPAFALSQDPDFLTLGIRVPYTRTSDFDLYIDGADIKFYAKPYFLRLTLPGRLVEDGRETAVFDVDEGLFTVRVPKETAGEHFEGLQMLTSLLAPKGSRSAKPLVEDMGSVKDCSGNVGEDEDEEEFDWQVEQEVYRESTAEELGAEQTYGFANRRSGVFARLQEELTDVIDVKNPEGTTALERRRARLEAEAAAFSPDHYLADLFEDEEIKGLLEFRPWWAAPSPPPQQEGAAAVLFSEDEREQLRKFTNRSYLLDKPSRSQVWLSLVDILLAYAYEVRSTGGEHNVESPWTIRKLSGTLSWLESFSSLQEVLVSFGRRVLCYPLYRHFGLVSAALGDTVGILQSGKACVLKCLLDIHKVFRHNDPAYILNDLYISDYCIWIQRVSFKKVPALAATLLTASLQKKDLELELEELEEAAAIVAEEEQDGEGEEEQRASSGDSSNESSSSDSSEESEAEGRSRKEGGGTAKDCPLQLKPSSPSSPLPQAPTASFLSAERKDSVPLSASTGSRQLIQELGERVADELRISEDVVSAAAVQIEGAAERSSSRTLLEANPRRNPLLIVQSQEGIQSFEQ